MKKLFALLLVAIMALSMVACGADKTATTEVVSGRRVGNDPLRPARNG